MNLTFLLLTFAASALAAPIHPAFQQAQLGNWLTVNNACFSSLITPGLCVSDGKLAAVPAPAGNFASAAFLTVDGVVYQASDPSDVSGPNADGQACPNAEAIPCGDTYTGGAASMSGLDVSMQYRARPEVFRALATFSNPGALPVNSVVEFASILDYVNRTLETSSGDGVFSANDQWGLVSAPFGATPGDNGRAAAYIAYGNGAPLTPFAGFSTGPLNADAWRSQFAVTVNPGETVRLLFFLRIATSRTAALGSLPALPGIAATDPLLADLSPATLAQIANYDFQAPVAAIPEPSTLALCCGAALCLIAVRSRR